MRIKLSLVFGLVAGQGSVELEKSSVELIEKLGLKDFDISAFHQYEGWTKDDFDVNYSHLLKEYYDGEINGHQIPRKAFRPTPVKERSGAEDQEYIKRFLQLKYAIMFLQKTKSIGRYCFYGCWCLPNGASDLGIGTGPPMDDIDRSCREYATCYNCLYNQEIGGQCDEENPGRYVIRGRTDESGKKILYCMNAPGTCQRNRCECDRGLAMKLAEYQDQWRADYHRRRGNPPFDAEQYCRVQVPQMAPVQNSADAAVFDQTVAGSSSAGAPMPVAASGSRFQGLNTGMIGGAAAAGGSAGMMGSGPVTINRVVSSAPIYGEIIGCCGRSPEVHYFRQGQKCCADGEIVDLHAPCSIDFL